LIYGPDFTAVVDEIRQQAPGVKYFVALGDKASDHDLAFAERENYPDNPPAELLLNWNDAWVICYTGGTTGDPKGAVLTHR
jgi:fatty-acyl-CoA synthase